MITPEQKKDLIELLYDLIKYIHSGEQHHESNFKFIAPRIPKMISILESDNDGCEGCLHQYYDEEDISLCNFDEFCSRQRVIKDHYIPKENSK